MDKQQLGKSIYVLQEENDTPALPFKLKLINRANILRVFRDGKEHTVSEVSALTGISKITTMRAIQFFCEKGVLVTGGRVLRNVSGGKYPEIFRLNITKSILSITLWPGVICLTLMDFSGQVLYTRQNNEVSTHEVSVQEIEEVLRRELKQFFEQTGADKNEVYGVAVSTAGIIDYKNKRIRYNAQAPEWGQNVPILEAIQDFFGEETYFFLENGAKAMARALLTRPEVAGKRVLMITTTWGIGGCMIENGRILNGRNSLIGEIGHVIVDAFDGERCDCGSRGCLERLVDIRRVRKIIREMPGDPLESGGLLAMDDAEITLQDVFRLSNEGDEAARNVVRYLAECFGVALRNAAVAFDPDLVYFIGEYGTAGLFFDQELKKKLREFRYYGSENPLTIVYEETTMLEMNRQGTVVALTDHYFDDPGLYEDPDRTTRQH